jgi:hypothetical protein
MCSILYTIYFASENALLDKVVSEMSIDLYSVMYPSVNQLGILFAYINVLGILDVG